MCIKQYFKVFGKIQFVEILQTVFVIWMNRRKSPTRSNLNKKEGKSKAIQWEQKAEIMGFCVMEDQDSSKWVILSTAD